MSSNVVQIIKIGENAASIADLISQFHDDEDAGVTKSKDGNEDQNGNIYLKQIVLRWHTHLKRKIHVHLKTTKLTEQSKTFN